MKKILFNILRKILWVLNPKKATKYQYYFLKKNGMNFRGKPRYISGSVWFDGSNYKKIKIGAGVTISSNVRILTHDWAADTIFEGLTGKRDYNNPIGVIRGVEVGDYCFIGTGSILMPGTVLGNRCVVAAGAVVRGKYDDECVIIGNPSFAIENTSSKKLVQKYTVIENE